MSMIVGTVYKRLGVPPASTTVAFLHLGINNLVGGSASGTWIGINANTGLDRKSTRLNSSHRL